ncbi:hypothetical protein PpBr36_01469, partial [Pyricularia pennisetigena]|uniref:hypothetical protein n=1 Tax=Pyricularia pennisetigena TaxID=1578925 RepID=UPI00114E6302
MRYSLFFIFVHTALATPKAGGTNQESEASTAITHTDGNLVTTNTNASNTNSNIIKRGYVTVTCSDSQETILKAAMRKCKTFADAAYYAVKNNQKLRRKYFKTDSAKHINAIRDVYWKIEQGCDLNIKDIPFRCEEDGSDCEDCNAYVYRSKARVHLCPIFFTYSLNFRAKILIHELSHLDC